MEPSSKSAASYWYLFVAAFALWLAGPLFLTKFAGSIAEGGPISDSYSAVNALFSGFAFATLILTLQLQRQELQDNRKELSRKAHQQQSTSLEQQATALEEQITVEMVTGRIQAMKPLLAQLGFEAEVANKGQSPSDYKLPRDLEGEMAKAQAALQRDYTALGDYVVGRSVLVNPSPDK